MPGFELSPLLYAELTALVTVVIIDLVLAGDNAVVVGLAAAGLPHELRQKAIIIGIGAAAALRIVFALFTTQLLGIIGLMLAGGLLLLWVSWKIWREIRRGARQHNAAATDALSHDLDGTPVATGGGVAVAAPAKTMGQALTQIVVADVSMSLDNVLAVAGTARHHVWVLIVGLALSVALMGVAASLVARFLHKFPWISYVGLALIAWVAFTMIREGGQQVNDPPHKPNKL
jgi:YjbE family integral membrane protein